MTRVRNSIRAAAAAIAVSCAALAVPTSSMAAIGWMSYGDLYGNWVATLGGFTGCGQSAMYVQINLNTAGVGTATLTTHGQCGDSVLTGQSFKVLTLNSNGSGTAGLSCGPGCGWNLRFQVAPDRGSMNLIDVDPVNPGNFISGVAIRQ